MKRVKFTLASNRTLMCCVLSNDAFMLINKTFLLKKLEGHSEVSVTEENSRGRKNRKKQFYCRLKNCSEDNKMINT